MSKKSNKKFHHQRGQKKPTVLKKTVPWFFYIFFGLLFGLLPFIYYKNGLDPAIHPRLLFFGLLLNGRVCGGGFSFCPAGGGVGGSKLPLESKADR